MSPCNPTPLSPGPTASGRPTRGATLGPCCHQHSSRSAAPVRLFQAPCTEGAVASLPVSPCPVVQAPFLQHSAGGYSLPWPPQRLPSAWRTRRHQKHRAPAWTSLALLKETQSPKPEAEEDPQGGRSGTQSRVGENSGSLGPAREGRRQVCREERQR